MGLDKLASRLHLLLIPKGLNMSVVGVICLFRVGPGYDGFLWGVLFRSDVR